MLYSSVAGTMSNVNWWLSSANRTIKGETGKTWRKSRVLQSASLTSIKLLHFGANFEMFERSILYINDVTNVDKGASKNQAPGKEGVG